METKAARALDVLSSPLGFRCSIDQGVSLYVRDWGGVGQVTTLLIHGSAEGNFVWDDFAPNLSAHCRVLGLDLRGHGESDYDPGHHYTFDRHVLDIRRVIDKLNLDNLILIGHSLGGDIAAKIAPVLGKKLRGLVVVDTGPGLDDEASRYVQNQLRESYKAYASVDEYAQWLRDRRLLAQPATLDRLAASSLVLGSDGLFWPKYDPAVIDMITADNDDSWWLDSLRQTSARVLIIRGLGSAALSKRTAELMSGAAQNGEISVIGRAGHAVMSDNPDGFSQSVIAFVLRCDH